MTLIKSLLLGSAAGIVAVASAQAADLPTKKAAPVEYVRVCNVGGITGWTLPGSDTCVKFSGYITAQFTGGNLQTQYNCGSINDALGADFVVNPLGISPLIPIPTPTGFAQNTQRVLIAASSAQLNTTFYRHQTGWTTRANFGFDMASNTAYGPLIGHFDINAEMGNGFDNTGTLTYLNTGYLTWAGITAGKAQSFYSFTGGGDNWANFASPDRKGFNEPDLMAYTASFGGGFSATISAESPGGLGGSGGGTDMTQGSLIYGGQKWPDIVGALHVKQGWGEAQISGVVHNVNVSDVLFNQATDCGITLDQFCNSQHNHVGWGVDAGVKVNLPSFGAGDDFLVTGSYTPERGLVLGSARHDVGRERPGERQRAVDVHVGRLLQPADQPVVEADRMVRLGPDRASLHAAILSRPRRVGRPVEVEQSGRRLQLLRLRLRRGPVCVGRSFADRNDLAGRRRPRLEPGQQPQLRPRVDVPEHEPDEAERLHRDHLQLGGVGGSVLVPNDWHGVSDGFAGRFRITRYF